MGLRALCRMNGRRRHNPRTEAEIVRGLWHIGSAASFVPLAGPHLAYGVTLPGGIVLRSLGGAFGPAFTTLAVVHLTYGEPSGLSA